MTLSLRKTKIESREFHDAFGVSVVTITIPEKHTIMEQAQHSISHLSFVARGSVLPDRRS